MLEAASKPVPSAAEAAALVRAMEAAQHPEDLAFDLRQPVVVAQRLLSGAATVDPAVAAGASDVVDFLNDQANPPDVVALRGFFYPTAPTNAAAEPKATEKKLAAHVGEVVPYAGKSLVLRRKPKSEKSKIATSYFIAELGEPA